MTGSEYIVVLPQDRNLTLLARPLSAQANRAHYGTHPGSKDRAAQEAMMTSPHPDINPPREIYLPYWVEKLNREIAESIATSPATSRHGPRRPGRSGGQDAAA